MIATQNPLDLVGTYPLPTAQLDRFLFKISMDHISAENELDLLLRFQDIKKGLDSNMPRVHRDEVIQARREIVSSIVIDPKIKKALVDFAGMTRESSMTQQGISSRSLVLALSALQARAMLEGRTFVSPDDLQVLSPYLFAHRLMLLPGAPSGAEVVGNCLVRPMETLIKSMGKR